MDRAFELGVFPGGVLRALVESKPVSPAPFAGGTKAEVGGPKVRGPVRWNL
ncbi:MAG TPA: hypothetical protein VFL51_08215 [Pseudolabrys sp.]|nr:hypothetical protein [Pseudolabrys sp.]